MFGRKSQNKEKASLLVEPGRLVSLSYQIEGENGELLESSQEKGLMTYVHGTDQLPNALQEKLQGHRVNDEVSIVLTPEDAYGPRDETRFQDLESPLLENDDRDIVVGQVFETVTREGRRSITVTAVSENLITVDLNHPLAGKVIRFTATVAEIADRNEPTLG